MKYPIRILFALATLFCASCIQNDIPYPLVELNIESVSGEGFSTSSIDIADQTVTLTLDEATDIRNVKIDEVTFGATPHSTSIDKPTLISRITTSTKLSGTFDMRTPIYVTLSLYQDYDWTILATQTIDRRFAVAGQVGASLFDMGQRTVKAYVSKDADLTKITVTSLRMGPEATTTYSPGIEELSGDFTSVRFVDVTSHGITERWRLYVLHTDKTVELTQADAWSRVIWLYGEGIEGVVNGFQYREKGAEQWEEAPDVTVEGGRFTARLNVKSETTYEVRAYCGSDQTDIRELTTDPVQQVPNSGMEDWSQPKAPWLPFLSDAAGKAIDPYWGSGNNGATTLGAKYNVTTPDQTDKRPGTPGNRSAKLASTYVAIKLAAGNIFVGEFAGIRGLTHGVVNFGRPFTLRPTAVRLWVKYIRGNLTDIGGSPVGMNLEKGQPDNGSVYVALGTWTKEKYGIAKDNELMGTDASPVSIDTRLPSTFFDAKGPDVIGYGEKIFTESTSDWQQIVIPIDYRNITDKKPTHIIVVCSASRWGDYFSGSRDSKMWVDDFELLYDYTYEQDGN